MNFRNLLWAYIAKSSELRKTSVQLWVNLGSPRKTSEIFFFFRCKVKVNIGNSKSIWGHGGRFDGQEVSSHFSWRGGGGNFIKKNLQILIRSPEVGISDREMIKKENR